MQETDNILQNHSTRQVWIWRRMFYVIAITFFLLSFFISVCVCFFSFILFHTLGLRKHVPSNEMVSIRHNKALGDCVFRELDVVFFTLCLFLLLSLSFSQSLFDLEFYLPLQFGCERFIYGLSKE